MCSMSQKVASFPRVQYTPENSLHLHSNGITMPSSDQLQILERLKQLRVWQQQQQESLLLRQQEQLAKLRGQEDSHRRQVGINFSGDRSSTSASSMSSSEDTTLRSLPETHPSQTLGSAASSLLLNHNNPLPGNGLPHKPVSIARVNGMVNSLVPNGLLALDSFSDGKDVKMNSNHFTPMPPCQLVQPSNAVRAVTIANGVPGIDSSETSSSDLSPLSEDSTALTADGVEEGRRVDTEKNAARDQADDHQQQIEACYHAPQPISFPGSPTHKSLGTRLHPMMLTKPSSCLCQHIQGDSPNQMLFVMIDFLMHNCMTH